MPPQAIDWDGRLVRRLKLRDLHILAAVVTWGSMAQAAKHLSMSQPAVSEAIAQLEDTLHVRLLDRSPAGIAPTIYADALLKRGLVVFDELKQGVRDIEFLADPGTGELWVGCPEFMAAGLLPAIIDRFSRHFPEVVVHAVDAPVGMMEFRALRDRKVDLMLARVPTDYLDHELDVELLFAETFFVVAGTKCPWARRRNIALKDLMHERWILHPEQILIRPLIEQAFRAHGLEVPRGKVSSVSMHVRNHLLATGRYLTILPGTTFQFNAKRWSLTTLPIDLGIAPVSTAVVTVKNRTLSPVVQVFIERARMVVKSLPRRYIKAV